MSYSGFDGGGYSKFYDQGDRNNFVRKVYSILGFQLLITACITAIPLKSDHARLWMDDHTGLLIAACVGSLVVCCTMICCLQLTRMVPINYILLLLFTVCEAYMLASVAAKTDP